MDHGPSSQQNTPSYVMFLGKVSSFFCEDVLQNLCSTHSLSGVSSQSCDDACEAVSGTCDLNTMKSETPSDLQSAFETLNTGYTFSVTLTFQVTSTLVVTDRSKNLGILYRRFFSGSGGRTIGPTSFDFRSKCHEL